MSQENADEGYRQRGDPLRVKVKARAQGTLISPRFLFFFSFCFCSSHPTLLSSPFLVLSLSPLLILATQVRGHT